MYLAFIAGLPSQQFVENASWSVLEEMSKRMVSRILVMNDDHNILELFRLILEPEGYEVHLAFIQLKHVSEVEKISPSLIILDLKFDHYAQGMLMLQ